MLSIRTQDRMALVPYDKPIMIREDGALFLIDREGRPYLKLGTYETKERALEVLDEIEIHSMGKLAITEPLINKDHWVNDYVVHIPKQRKEQIIPLSLVYQMPTT